MTGRECNRQEVDLKGSSSYRNVAVDSEAISPFSLLRRSSANSTNQFSNGALPTQRRRIVQTLELTYEIAEMFRDLTLYECFILEKYEISTMTNYCVAFFSFFLHECKTLLAFFIVLSLCNRSLNLFRDFSFHTVWFCTISLMENLHNLHIIAVHMQLSLHELPS